MIRELTLNSFQTTLTPKKWDDFVNTITKCMGENLIIPDSYKEFMFKYNGGAFNECVLNDTSVDDAIVNWFYSWGENEENSLNVILKNFNEDYFGYGFLPFADDPGGDYYLLNLNPDGNGEIYYWSHDDVFENGDSKKLIFKTFTDFLNALESEE